jgi:hypothetical protein
MMFGEPAVRCRSAVDESFTEVSLCLSEVRMQTVPLYESWAGVNFRIDRK